MRVMVVDDSRFMQEEIVHLLAGSGYEVAAVCRDAEEAIHSCEGQLPDVVLMDVVLPGIDGIEATKTLLGKWPSLKVVIMSSLAFDETLRQAEDVGAASCLFKPFGVGQLLQALDGAVAK